MSFSSVIAKVIVFVIALGHLPLTSSEAVVIDDGHVYIELMATLHGNDNGTCDDTLDVDVVQNIEAVRWTLNRLREENFFTNLFHIGLRVHPTCRSVDVGRKAAVDIVNQMTNLSPGQHNNIVGIFGPDFSSETEAVSELISALPDQYRLLQLGYTATAVSLKDKSRFRNFFRFIPADDIQIEAMGLLLKRLNWTYMAAVYDDDAYGRGGIQSLRDQNEGQGLCFMAEIPVSTALSESEMVTLMTSQLRSLVLERTPHVGGFVVFGSHSLSNAIFTAAENVFQNSNVTVPVFMFSEAAGYFTDKFKAVSGGSFVLGPRKLYIQEFQNYWTNLFTNYSALEYNGNPWLKQTYAKAFNCSVSNQAANPCLTVPADDINQKLPASFYNQFAVQTTMTMSLVTKRVRDRHCTDGSACVQFLDAPRQEFIDVMNNLDVNFDEDFSTWRIPEFRHPDLLLHFNGSTEAILRTSLPSYEVFNHRECTSPAAQGDTFCFVEVGNFSQDGNQAGLSLDVEAIRDYNGNETSSWPHIRKAQCPDGLNCEGDCPTSTPFSHDFIRGDLYIVGIAPVHSKGETPVQCGGIKGGGFDVVESMKFAVKEARNNFPQDIPTGNIGVIIIDSCNDPQVIQEKVLSLYRNGIPEDLTAQDRILGFVGAWSSDVSVALGNILTRLKFPQISYGSTSPVLSNLSIYPYFLRITSSDIYQAETIIKITESIGSKYVQLLYSDGAYGEGGRDLIRIKAKELDTCIVNEVRLVAGMDTSIILNSLRQHSGTKVVIMWASSFDTDWLLPLLNDNFQQNEFVYIASEGLGTRDVVQGFSNLVGSISVASELPPNSKFSDTLKSLIPDGSLAKSWLREYMESTFNCYFEWSLNKSFSKQCSGTERLDPNLNNFKLETWVPFAENAVYALLKGSRVALQQLCSRTDAICPAFRQNPDTVVARIKEVRLNLDRLGNDEAVFDTNGDGLVGYNIYTMELDSEKGVIYKTVGESDPTGSYFFQTDVWRTIARKSANSTCTNVTVCDLCGLRTTTAASSEGIPGGIIAVIAILGVTCCLLAAVLLYICNRHGCCVALEKGKPKFTNTYLHAIYRDGGHQNNVDVQDDYNVIHDRGMTGVSMTGGARSGEFGTDSTSGMGSSAGVSDGHSLPSRHDDYFTPVSNST